MRILYTLARKGDSAAADYLLGLVRGFGGKFDIQLATGGESEFTAEARRAGAECHILPGLDWGHNPLRAAEACGQFLALVGKLAPDLINAHDRRTALLAHQCGAPSVYTAHHWDAMSWIDRLAVRSSGYVITRSDEARRSVARRCRIDPLRTMTIRHGIKDEGSGAMPASGGIANFVVASPFDGTTNDQMILEAFAGVDSASVLTFVGEGDSMPWMRGLSFKLGLGGRVRFLGARDDLNQVLARAHGLVWAGRRSHSGVPTAVVQAMRAGLPVVATDTGLIHEAVATGDNGYLAPAGDIGGFRNALWALAADSSLRERAGSASRRRFELNFSLRQMLEKAEALYEHARGAGVRNVNSLAAAAS